MLDNIASKQMTRNFFICIKIAKPTLKSQLNTSKLCTDL